MTCTCKYSCEPSQIVQGAPGYTFCRVIQEFRKTPAQHREDYQREIQRRLADSESGSGRDLFYRLQKLGVPFDALEGLRHSRETVAMMFAKRFGQADRTLCRTLVLAGPRGVGKSTAAAQVLWDWAKHYPWDSQASGGRQGPPAAWMDAREVTREQDYGRVNPQWLDGLRACEMLVVDDIGKDATEAGLVALTDLLVHRHEKRRPTVITSNLDPHSLQQRYGESWWARLRACSSIPDLRHEKSLRGRPK